MLEFIPIDLEQHSVETVRFRNDSFLVSFGEDAEFDEEDYLQWLTEQTALFPDGFVMAVEDGKPVGQLELTVREYEGRMIGYVNLYYLSPMHRGKGKGQELHAYAREFFRRHEMKEFHLRVAPTNKAAFRFYQKIGMEEIGPVVDGKVIRMKGHV